MAISRPSASAPMRMRMSDPEVGPVDVSTVSVQMIIKHCDAFAGMNAARNNNDKVTSDKISLALDNHPDYERMKGRPRVDGQQVRRAWRRTTPAPTPAPAPSGSGSFDASEQWGETVNRLNAERMASAPASVAARAAVGFIPEVSR